MAGKRFTVLAGAALAITCTSNAMAHPHLYFDKAGKPVVTSATSALFDVKVDRDTPNCVRVYASEAKTLEGPPYSVRAHANEIYLNAKRVGFRIENNMTVFPMDDDIGEGCKDVWETDGGTGLDADERETGLPDVTLTDAAIDLPWIEPDGGLHDATSRRDEGEDAASDGGCDCRLATSTAYHSGKAGNWLLLLSTLALGMRGRRRYKL